MRPHRKARFLGDLANHIAMSQKPVASAVQTATYDLGSGGDGAVHAKAADMVTMFDANVADAKGMLAEMTDADLMSVWEGQAREPDAPSH